MFSLWQMIILGVVQGATEFLPVSSSGHLVLVAELLNLNSNLAVETLLNWGTILVILIFFWRQIWQVGSDLIFRTLSLAQKKDIILKLVIGVLPAVLTGLVLGDFIEQKLHGTNTVIVMLVAVGLGMIFARPKTEFKNLRRDVRTLNTNIVQEVSYKQAAVIGLVQPLALISGTSRSGITILAGILTGLKTEVAAAYSFLIGLPVIFGATLKLSLSSEGQEFLKSNLSLVLAGNLASFGVGLIAAYSLMNVIKKHGLKPFGYYRVALAVAVSIYVLVK
jgi:undecaprenyl-diphosphatase